LACTFTFLKVAKSSTFDNTAQMTTYLTYTLHPQRNVVVKSYKLL